MELCLVCGCELGNGGCVICDMIDAFDEKEANIFDEDIEDGNFDTDSWTIEDSRWT